MIHTSLLPEQLSNIIVQHRWDPDFNPHHCKWYCSASPYFFTPKNVGWKKSWPWRLETVNIAFYMFSALLLTPLHFLRKKKLYILRYYLDTHHEDEQAWTFFRLLEGQFTLFSCIVWFLLKKIRRYFPILSSWTILTFFTNLS